MKNFDVKVVIIVLSTKQFDKKYHFFDKFLSISSSETE